MNEALLVSGIVLTAIGVLAAGYTVYENKTYFFGAFKETEARRPYASLSIPLIILGISIMIVSAVIPTTRTITKRSYIETPVKKTKVVEKEE